MRDAARPLTDWLGNTRVGRIARQAYQRIKPAVQALRPKKAPKPPAGPKYTTRPVARTNPVVRANVVTPGNAAGGAGTAARGAAAASAGASGGAGTAAAGVAAGAAGAGAAVPIAGAVIAAAAALYELTKAAKDAGVALVNQQEARLHELSEFSGQHASAEAQLEAGRAQRAVESGEATGDSAEKFADSLDRFEEAARPLKDLVDTLQNLLGSGILDALTAIIEPVGQLAKAATDIAENLPFVGKAIKDRNEQERNRQKEGGLFGDILARTYQDQERRAKAARDAIDATRRAHDRGI